MRTSITTLITCLALGAGLSLTTACDPDRSSDADDDVLRAVEAAPAAAPEFDPAPLSEQATRATPAIDVDAPAALTPPTADPAIPGAQWRVWVDSEVARVSAETPEWFAHLMNAEPQRTRSGFLRFVGPAFQSPSATPVLLHRYTTSGEAPAVRAAVVAALARTGGDYTGPLTELMADEPEALVRVGMVAALQRADGPEALAALALALDDGDPDVRVTAAFSIGRRADGGDLAQALTKHLGDSDARVQAAAARALGFVKADGATGALSELLTHRDAGVRLRALQAIDRIDPQALSELGTLEALTTDADEKVAHAAQKIAGR